ncbi:MAG: hypothetical protein WAK12_05415 [Acidimicrobiales bacterium]
MGLFRRIKRNAKDDVAYPAQEAVEAHEISGSTLIGPGALGAVQPAGSGVFGQSAPEDETIATKELRAAADPEDDGARELLIEEERRREEFGR